MARTLIIIGALILLTWGTAAGEVNKSKHDLIYYFGHDEQGGGAEACPYCHHLSNSQLAAEQKWDSSSDVRGFDVYYSKNGDEFLLCQSCHDGVTIPDIFGEKEKGANHPVGFDYVELSYKEKRFPYYDYKLGGVKGVASGEVYPLKDMKMSCITCHDPHKGEARFVRGGKNALRGSILCIDCHVCINDSCR